RWKCSFCRRRQGQDRLGLEPPPGAGMQRVPSVRRMTQRMEQLGREESIVLPELSVDLEEKINLEGGPPRSLEKGRSGRLAGESERSFSLEGRYSTGIKQNDEKNQLRSWPPVDRQKSLESSSKIRGSSSPERTISHHRDGHLSLDAALERRSFFEYRRSSRGSPTGHALYNSTNSGHHHHKKNHSQQRYSSASESSVDECFQEDLEEKQRQNRIRKRSRIQRQKYYVEEPDSDPTLNRPDIQARRDVKPPLTSRRIFGGSVEALNRCTSYVTGHSNEKPESTGVSSVPGQQSSDSSDFSEELSPVNDRSEHERYDPYYAYERLAVRKPTKKLQKSRRHTIDLDEDHKVNLTGTPDSSPEEYVTVDKSHSLDDHEAYSYSTFRRSIPSVFVNTVPDIDPPSQPYPQSEDLLRRHSTGRALPRVPVPENLLRVHSFSSDSNFSIHSLDLPRDEKCRTERRASAPERDNVQIVIDDVNCESQRKSRQKKVHLQRDMKDTGARTRGFGMRVIGGKSADDARMCATVTWTRPGGPADQNGICQGDRILEWGGVTLVDRTFEEVSTIIERTGDSVEVVVEQDSGKTNGNKSSGRSSHHSVIWSSSSPKRSPTLTLQPDQSSAQDVQSISPTRRKLPRTPVANK
ncbi:regulating synaptic membrane exocytosis protein 2-like, partial [Limulus polyphemus]|uniref:Regulating synaptic membrane exocytosis protein 2-like n=1 Tax=Limulus polyphemus TaxID=6850 RepID=A0ABM1RY65_LIMPO